jgi:hypothetical protein
LHILELIHFDLRHKSETELNEAIMKHSMIRIALWATAGFLVSAGWGFYFASTNKATPIGPIVYGLVNLTQPIAAITHSYFDFPHGLAWTVVENAATYGLIGLFLETTRRRRRLVHI